MRSELRFNTLAPALIAASIAISISTTAAAQPAINGLEQTGKFVLEVEGEEDAKARVFQTSSPPAILIVAGSSKLPDPVMLDVSQGAVRTVNFLQMSERSGGSVIDLLPGARLKEHPGFAIDGVDTGLKVRFSVDGVEALLRPKPPLLGDKDAEDLVRHSPEYEVKAKAYKPSGPVIERLRGERRAVTVKVFFGSWCSACAQLVPLIMGVEEALDGSNIDFDYYGLPQGQGFKEDPQAARYNITGVPTGVVLIDGKEVGRLKGNDWRIPEMSINKRINGS